MFVNSTFSKAIDKIVLFSFENEKDLKLVETDDDDTPANGSKQFPLKISDKNATDGKYSLEVTFTDVGVYPGIFFSGFEKNWDDYEILKIDVYNPTDKALDFDIGITDNVRDRKETDKDKEYAKRYTTTVSIVPGKNTIEIESQGIVKYNSKPVNLKNMKQIAIFNNTKTPVTLYIDNIRLEREK